MKSFLIIAPILLWGLDTFAQGTFVYDQQSADENTIMEGSGAVGVLAQSFTPSLSAVGFVRLYVGDANLVDGLGASIRVNLRSGGVSGAVLGSTSYVSLPSNSAGPVNFLFAAPIVVSPGQTYYFDAEAQAGSGAFGLLVSNYGYANGAAFFSGTQSPTSDLWFREGVVVPEPSVVWLLPVLGGGLLYVRKKCSSMEG